MLLLIAGLGAIVAARILIIKEAVSFYAKNLMWIKSDRVKTMDCLLVSWIIQSKMTSVFIVDRFPYAAEYELGGRLSILNFSFSEYPNCYFIFLFFTSRHERLVTFVPCYRLLLTI